MIDRFNDGDSSNNDLGKDEYDPAKESHFSGGDIKGIIEKLDYLQELGVTALWITPPVLNQWVNRDGSYTGYHGYWARHFAEMDPHFGSLNDYRNLSRELHARGMYLIQDVVCNHSGDYFYYEGNYDPENPAQNFRLHSDEPPSQFPFDKNDARREEDLRLAAYHFTPTISDFSDPAQKLTYGMSALDDLNTANPLVRKTLKESFRFWIEAVGVDAYRFDTPLYVEHEFWHDFLHSDDPEELGIVPFAKQMGKEHFYTFGETWVSTDPLTPEGDLHAASYLGTKEKPEMDAYLNFPLLSDIERVFKAGQATQNLGYRLQHQQELLAHPEWLPTFIDNHDMPRFLSGVSQRSFEQALLFIMTVPGVPVIYYGTEQLFTETRPAMFAGGFASDAKDHFDTKSKGFRFMQTLIELRKSYPTLSQGKFRLIKDSPYGAGPLIYEMATEQDTLWMAFNTSKQEVYAFNIDAKNHADQSLEPIYHLDGDTTKVEIPMTGILHWNLPPQSVGIYKIVGIKTEAQLPSFSVKLDPLQLNKSAAKLAVTGEVEGQDNIYFAIDGTDWSTSGDLTSAGEDLSSFRGEIKVGQLLPGKHMLTAFCQPFPESKEIALAEQREFILEFDKQYQVSVNDPINDDNGRGGNYIHPTDSIFKTSLDIEAVDAYWLGHNLAVELTMVHPFSTVWNPNNGFDHLQLSIYVDLPDREGVGYMPFRNAELPEGMKWDYYAQVAGWSNELFSAEGAGPENNGQALTPTGMLTTIPEKRIIKLFFPSSSLGYPQQIRNTRIYVSTWDVAGEGNLRPIAPEAAYYTFGGGEADAPKIMDELGPVIIK